MVLLVAAIAILIIIYMGRAVEKRRIELRANHLERKRDLFEKLIDAIRSQDGKQKTETNEN